MSGKNRERELNFKHNVATGVRFTLLIQITINMWRQIIWAYYFETLENRHLKTGAPDRRETQGISYMLAPTFCLVILSGIQCREMETKQDRQTHWLESDIKFDAPEEDEIFKEEKEFSQRRFRNWGRRWSIGLGWRLGCTCTKQDWGMKRQ